MANTANLFFWVNQARELKPISDETIRSTFDVKIRIGNTSSPEKFLGGCLGTRYMVKVERIELVYKHIRDYAYAMGATKALHRDLDKLNPNQLPDKGKLCIKLHDMNDCTKIRRVYEKTEKKADALLNKMLLCVSPILPNCV